MSYYATITFSLCIDLKNLIYDLRPRDNDKLGIKYSVWVYSNSDCFLLIKFIVIAKA